MNKNINVGTVALSGLGLLGLLSSSPSAEGAIINFDLLGKGGPGLLSTNENGAVVNGGSGGEMGQGIYLDTDDNRLYVLVEWGSANGYTDLTGPATVQHIHGPTPSSGAASFLENAGVLFGLEPLAFIVDPSPTSGSINGSAPLTDSQVADLLEGRYYINVHTTAFPAGEIRANLVVSVPEPLTSVFFVSGLGVAAWVRRRQVRS